MPAETGVGPIVTTLTKIFGTAAVALLLAGLAFGFRSVSDGAVDCGSVFAPAGGITPMACDGKLDSAATLVTVLVVAGALSLAAAIALKVVNDRRVKA